MVRSYKKLAGTRKYRNYTKETLEEALEKITDGMSISAASKAYDIPFGTLYNRFKGLYCRRAGGQTSFTRQEEQSLLKAAATCSDWGFPLTTFDLRMIAKAYLDSQGKNIEKFPNNIPGVDWALNILKRHKNEYGQKVASNIKRARERSHETLCKYFNNLEKEVEGVPPSNIFSYDESNLSDDPETRCIYRRGVKYPERMLNHSKSCTTIMMCGSADGTLLPPYVIYKSLHLYDTWKGGIVGKPCCPDACCNTGSRYNRTQSGWIDAPTFRDWFTTAFLPHARKLDGRKVIIGDYLSSHLNLDVLDLCRRHNISFVCLPNSTHICHPLDVGFFRPMKIAWHKVLEEWKQTHQKASGIPKDIFANLLKRALIKMDEVPQRTPSDDAESSVIKRNLKNGFRATGIYPFDRNTVLKKVPNSSSADSANNKSEREGGLNELSCSIDAGPSNNLTNNNIPSCDEQSYSSDVTKFEGPEVEDDDDDSNSSVKFSSEVWGQFEQEGSLSRCTICKQTTESTIESMKSHLEEDHPGILIGILQNKTFDTTDPIDERSQEADEETFTEVVYLEEEPNRHRPKKRKPALTEPHESKVETKVPAEPQRPEIDTFLSYVGVLLRTVPKDTLPKLQLDVISLILNAQMASASNTPKGSIATVTNVGNYQITIQNEDVSGS